MLVFINGAYVDTARASVSAFDRGFLFGDGVFETLRIYKGYPYAIHLHLERMLDSARCLGFQVKYTQKYISDVVTKLIQKNNIKDGYARITLTRGRRKEHGLLSTTADTTLTVEVKKYTPPPVNLYKNGVRAVVSKIRRFSNSIVVRHKTLNQIENIIALREAVQAGAYEAIFLNESGHILEGSRTNIFFIRKGVVHTPDLACGLLAGITRKIVIEICQKMKIPLREGKYKLDFLARVDEVFLTNSLIEIMPVSQIDRYKFKCHKITQIIRQAYHSTCVI